VWYMNKFWASRWRKEKPFWLRVGSYQERRTGEVVLMFKQYVWAKTIALLALMQNVNCKKNAGGHAPCSEAIYELLLLVLS
jgi:hypothetical protein